MDLVSVIVPAYNIQNYIRRCVDSIRNQTYSELEILLIDDGSTDDTGELCDEFAQQDERITVYHKKNGGLSSARNYGIERAHGTYLSFIDADDWVKRDFIEVLYQNIKRANAELSIVGYSLIWDNGKEKCTTDENAYAVFNQDEAIHELFAQEKMGCMACQRLYHKSIFEDIRFSEGKLFEDAAIALDVVKKCHTVVWSGQSKYYYYQRSDSIVNSTFNIGKLFMLESCQNMIDYSKKNGGKYDKEANAFYLKSAMMLLMQIYGAKDSAESREAKEKLKEGIRKHKQYIWGNKYLPLRKKIILSLMKNRWTPEKLIYILWKTRMEN